MAQKKVFVCDRCGEQTPDDKIISVVVEGKRVFDGVESFNKHHRADWCVGCAQVAMKSLAERHGKLARRYDEEGFPAVEWMKEFKAGERA